MEKLKALFKNKKFVISAVAVILLSIVCVAFALNQPQNKNETVQQETIPDEEHAKLLANIKKLQNADQKKTATVVADKKVDEDKAKVEQLKKEEEKQKEKDQSDAFKQKVEETKKTQPVQPKPRKEMQKDVVLPQHQKKQTISQPTQPVVKPEVPKSLSKPPVASAKPKPVERKRIGNLGNSGLEFKTYDEARNFGNKILNSTGEDWEEWNKKMGFEIFGWSGWTVDYSDGSQTWTIQWKP